MPQWTQPLSLLLVCSVIEISLLLTKANGFSELIRFMSVVMLMFQALLLHPVLVQVPASQLKALRERKQVPASQLKAPKETKQVPASPQYPKIMEEKMESPTSFSLVKALNKTWSATQP